MILEFAITNFRSIKNREVMDFRASNAAQKKDHLENLSNFPPEQYKGNVIKSAIIYGANASGKSNFLKAFQVLEEMVVNSNNYKLDKPIQAFNPFLLDQSSSKKPTVFEIEFVAKDQRRYFYEVAIEKFQVLKEELSVYPNGRKTTRKAILFSRKAGEPIVFGDYRGKKDFALNDNQLLLTQAGLNKIPSLSEPYRFFSTYLFNAPAYSSRFDEKMLAVTEEILSDDQTSVEYLEFVNSIIRAADTGISKVFTKDIWAEKIKLPDEMSEEERQKILDRFKRRIKTAHPVFEDGKEIAEAIFDLSQESTGTIKLLGLAGYVVDALHDGSVIVVDELDKNLHPLLTRMIVRLFHNPDFNKKSAQLIFSSHDISLIDRDLFRLDQIFLTDKSTEGISSISRLSDFKGITKVKSLQKWYSIGMFKGIPAINDYEINLKESFFAK